MIMFNKYLRMKRRTILISFLILASLMAVAAGKKADPVGRLAVSADGRFLQYADGRPFFWLGDTGWLLPERLDRDEAAYYLDRLAAAGYNVVQVQVINAIPAFNAYGQMSMPSGFNFEGIDRPGVYGYWDHMDYIIDQAARRGIYVGMVCIWGGMVKAGLMDADEARAYGKFLAGRYKDKKNIASTCSRAATVATASAWATRITLYPTAPRRTTGCTLTLPGSTSR